MRKNVQGDFIYVATFYGMIVTINTHNFYYGD